MKVSKLNPKLFTPETPSRPFDLHINQTVRDFLPLALLAARTFLPPFVAILARNPWTL